MQQNPWDQDQVVRPSPYGRVVTGRAPVATPQTAAQEAASRAAANNANTNAVQNQTLTGPQAEAIRLQNLQRQRELVLQNLGVTPQGLEGMRQRAESAQELRARLDRYDEHFRPYEGRLTPGEWMVPGFLPQTHGIQQLDSDRQGMESLIRQMMRTPGDPQAMSETASMLEMLPSTSSYDTTNRERVTQLRAQLDRTIGRYQSAIQQVRAVENPNQVQSGESMGQVGGLPNVPIDDGRNVAGAGGAVLTDADRHVASVVNALVNSRVPVADTINHINNILSADGRQLLTHGQAEAIRSARQRGARFEFTPTPRPRSQNESRSDTIGNLMGHGSSREAFIGRVIGAGGGDLIGMLPGDLGQRYRDAMGDLRDAHPTASLVGDVAGSILPMGAMERGAAGIASRAGLDITEQGLSRGIPRIASNTGYGALSGFANANEGEGLEGAVMGGTLSAAGGEAGRATTQLGGRVLRGIDNAPTRYLNAQGVPMTIGEIARATNTRAGNVVAGLEDRLSGFPVIGDMINYGRQQGRRGFNQAALRQGVEPITPPLPNGARPPSPITATGSEGIQQGQQLVGGAYDNALQGVNIPLDAQYGSEMAAARANGVATGAEQATRLDAAANYINNNLATNQNMSGPEFQAALQVLSRERSGVDGGMAQELRGAFDQASDAVTGAANRAAPEAVPALNAANQAYRNMGVLGDARIRAQNQPEELFTPAQLRSVSTQNTVNYGGRNAARAGEEPFHELTAAGQAAQGNRVPDSGSAGRAAMLGIPLLAGAGGGMGAAGSPDDRLGGAEGGAGTALKYGGLAALLYTRGGQRLIQTVLSRRPQLLRDIGQRINEGRIPVLSRPGQGTLPQIGGAAGAGILRSLGFPPPEDEPPTMLR